MRAATLDPSNQAHFEDSSRLLQNPDVSADDAALGACSMLVGKPKERPGSSESGGVAGSGGSGQAAAAAARSAQRAAGAAVGRIAERAP